MSKVNSITSEILRDAEERKESILKQAEEEKAKILKKKEEEAKREEALILAKAESEAQTRKERIISSAELKARNEKLAAKQVVIDQIFNESVERLNSLQGSELTDFFKNTIVSLDLVGDENIIVNEEGKKILEGGLLDEINSELVKKGLKGELKLSGEARKISGGFIVEKNGIEINNTFEALVNSLRDELEYDVAKVLFN